MVGNKVWLAALCFSVQQALAQEMCQVPGASGTCGIAPFLQAEAAKDKEGYNCEKLRGAQYFYGECVGGRLNGLVGLKRAPDARWDRRASSAFLLLVSSGTPENVAVEYANWGIATSSITNGRQSSGAGCVNWQGGWDHRASYSDCVLAAQVFGAEVMQRSFAQQMLAEKAVLSAISVTIKGAGSEASTKDDPKVRGRSARVI